MFAIDLLLIFKNKYLKTVFFIFDISHSLTEKISSKRLNKHSLTFSIHHHWLLKLLQSIEKIKIVLPGRKLLKVISARQTEQSSSLPAPPPDSSWTRKIEIPRWQTEKLPSNSTVFRQPARGRPPIDSSVMTAEKNRNQPLFSSRRRGVKSCPVHKSRVTRVIVCVAPGFVWQARLIQV